MHLIHAISELIINKIRHYRNSRICSLFRKCYCSAIISFELYGVLFSRYVDRNIRLSFSFIKRCVGVGSLGVFMWFVDKFPFDMVTSVKISGTNHVILSKIPALNWKLRLGNAKHVIHAMMFRNLFCKQQQKAL